jgi:uncharacterized protein (DUF1015 family)
MADVRPFSGLRPPRALVQQVAAPPYDVVSTSEARAHAGSNPHSFFRVSRPEIELADSVDPHSEPVYALGRKNLEQFVERGTLVADAAPRFYVYRQRMGDHSQAGIVGGASVAEYDRGLIKKHELTRADKEDDRVAHIDRLSAHDEPVFLAYRARPELVSLQQEIMSAAPEYDFTAEDGVQHTFWIANERQTEQLVKAFGNVDALYVADGHHRSAAASRVAAKNRLTHPEASHFLSVIFPHDQLRIMDYNRLVKDLNGLSSEAFMARVLERFELQPDSPSGRPGARHRFGMFLGGTWHTLAAKSGTFDPKSPLGSLDVSILQDNLLGPILGIKDPRTDQRIAFVGGIRGMSELEKRVRSGEHTVAFALFPTSLDELMAIADAGQIMPPKSTWFEPKLRSGLVVHRF